jgi:hypothetical protein
MAGAAEAAPSAAFAPWLPRPPSLAQAHHYLLPELLHDIRLLDLLELCGTTGP